MSDITQLQDLHQAAFIGSLNWDGGRAIKSRKGSFTKYCRDSLIFDTPNCEEETFPAASEQSGVRRSYIMDCHFKKLILV